MAEARRVVEGLWQEYRPLADRNFLSDAKTHFLQRFWEMYLGVTLIGKGFSVKKDQSEGPEFYFMNGQDRLWIEAIAPEAGAGPDAVSQPPLNKVTSVPQEQILLRFTGALKEKLGKYNAALNKAIVNAGDPYVVAINCRGIPHAVYGSILPYYVMAYLPFGHPELLIDKLTLQIADSHFQYRDHVTKASGFDVSTAPLLSPDYTGISGVLHSPVYPTDPWGMDDDFSFLHNPLASSPIPSTLFSFCRQYFFKDYKLETLEPTRPANGGPAL